MPTKHLETAVFLLKVAPNPLILDAIRVLSTPKYDPKITAEAKKYVEKCYGAYEVLFTNAHEVYTPRQWYTPEGEKWDADTDIGKC